MGRFLITGSSDGLGLLTAQSLIQKGHRVVLHARNAQRAKDAEEACPNAETTLIADFTKVSEIKKLSEEANALGRFDCIIHNAGFFTGPFEMTEDGFPKTFSINTIAPYLLTCLVKRPKRLVYISSSMHLRGDEELRDITWQERGEQGWRDNQAYCDSKLYVVLLALAVSRKWPKTFSSVIDPGWVPTKMGGRSATGNLGKALEGYLLLALDEDGETAGKYFTQNTEGNCKAAGRSDEIQDKLLSHLEEITGIKLQSEDQV